MLDDITALLMMVFVNPLYYVFSVAGKYITIHCLISLSSVSHPLSSICNSSNAASNNTEIGQNHLMSFLNVHKVLKKN